MSKYIVTARLRLVCGVLTLSADQANPRAHALKPLGKNRFEIINPVEFKVGEKIGYEGELPKALADNLTSAEDTEKAAKKAADAEAKAKALAEADAKKARDKIESDALDAWQNLPELREQHANDFDAYLAFVLEQAA
ncbi:MAG: hypothetical protein A2143_02350 [Gallionellales bacterium RBG_16_57_15]|nr:MAG: hypothetical protein A2143_02350 [Gallionellales bacterium RBG_16_57_15]